MILTQEQQSAVDKAMAFLLDTTTDVPYFIINGGAKSGKTTVFSELCHTLDQTIQLLNSLNEESHTIILGDLGKIAFKDTSKSISRLGNNAYTNLTNLENLVGHLKTDSNPIVFLVDNIQTKDIQQLCERASPFKPVKFIFFTTDSPTPNVSLTACYSPYQDLLGKELQTYPEHLLITYLPEKEFDEQVKQTIMNDPVHTIHIYGDKAHKLSLDFPNPVEGMLYRSKNHNNPNYCRISKVFAKNLYAGVKAFADKQVIETTPLLRQVSEVSLWDSNPTRADIIKGMGIIFDQHPVISLDTHNLTGLSYQTVYADIQNPSQLQPILATATKHIYIKGGS